MNPARVERLAVIYRRDRGWTKPKLRLCLYLAIRLGARLPGSLRLLGWAARLCPPLHDAVANRYRQWTRPTTGTVQPPPGIAALIGPAERRIRQRLLQSRQGGGVF